MLQKSFFLSQRVLRYRGQFLKNWWWLRWGQIFPDPPRTAYWVLTTNLLWYLCKCQSQHTVTPRYWSARCLPYFHRMTFSLNLWSRRYGREDRSLKSETCFLLLHHLFVDETVTRYTFEQWPSALPAWQHYECISKGVHLQCKHLFKAYFLPRDCSFIFFFLRVEKYLWWRTGNKNTFFWNFVSI